MARPRRCGGARWRGWGGGLLTSQGRPDGCTRSTGRSQGATRPLEARGDKLPPEIRKTGLAKSYRPQIARAHRRSLP
eukprot:scaffold106785_cov42-Phaeocystis_antarctica.AAC.1